jgi:hypothetical protein
MAVEMFRGPDHMAIRKGASGVGMAVIGVGMVDG